MVGREWVKDDWDVHTGWEINIQWTVSSSFCFHKTGIGPSKNSESS